MCKAHNFAKTKAKHVFHFMPAVQSYLSNYALIETLIARVTYGVEIMGKSLVRISPR